MKNTRRIDIRRATARVIELTLDPEHPIDPAQRRRELDRRATAYAVAFFTDPEMQR